MKKTSRKALIIVDVQNDFCAGGSLAVPNADEVVPVANRLMPTVDLVVATLDWHPANHGSFASNHPGKNVFDVVDLNGVEQVLWPDHCVQDTFGAEFRSGLELDGIDEVVRKGMDPSVDSYSAFYDNNGQNDSGLGELLRNYSIEKLLIMGLATDYCVKFTALDARKLGYPVILVERGCRAVNAAGLNGENPVKEMQEAGCSIWYHLP